jgi:hypothetical protein
VHFVDGKPYRVVGADAGRNAYLVHSGRSGTAVESRILNAHGEPRV